MFAHTANLARKIRFFFKYFILGANTMSNDTLSRYTLSNCIRKKVEARKGEVEQSVRRLSATIADNIVENNNDAVKSDVVVGVGADKRHIIKVNE